MTGCWVNAVGIKGFKICDLGLGFDVNLLKAASVYGAIAAVEGVRVQVTPTSLPRGLPRGTSLTCAPRP